MRLLEAIAIAALLVLVPAVSGEAQLLPYPPYNPNNPAQVYSPPWSYDPYTSGLGPCPQRRSGSDPPCSETMPPSYGQPSYWPTR